MKSLLITVTRPRAVERVKELIAIKKLTTVKFFNA